VGHHLDIILIALSSHWLGKPFWVLMELSEKQTVVTGETIMKKQIMATAILEAVLLGGALPANAQFLGIKLPTLSEVENTVKNNVPHIDTRSGQIHMNTPGGPRVMYNSRNGQWQATPGPVLEGAAGEALAQAIWAAKGRISWRPIPADIANSLRQMGVNPGAIARAKYSTDWGAAANGTIHQVLLGNGLAGAVTLEDIIVFRDGRSVSDLALWAHELKHVEQYSQMGVRGFAQRYVADHNSLEGPGYAEQNRVEALVSSGQSAPSVQQNFSPFQNQPVQRPATYYSFCATQFGNSPTFQGGLPNGAACSIPTPQGVLWGQVRGFFQ